MASASDYQVLRHAAGLIDRSAERGRLRLSGADRRRYLQGLLTNDIEALTPGTGCYAAYLTAQGRMIADMRLFELGEALIVDMDRRVSDLVRDKWDAFIFSEDVTIEDRSAALSQLGLYGPLAPRVLAEALGAAGAQPPLTAEALEAMPLHACDSRTIDGQDLVVLRSDAAGEMGFDILMPVERTDDVAGHLERAGAVRIGAEAVEARRIESGRLRFGIDMTVETIPLEAGIEDRAISLTKGCYVGQEVIIRVLHRGHGRVARRLVGLSLASNEAPPRGTAISSGEREVGAVTSAVRSPALGHAIALGYVHRDFTAAGTALTVAGVPATVSVLPFA
ncbi:MAG: glycine cleavage T C-terminal barrel domain-containing protein [Acidobacteriota bacterium]